MLTHYHILVNVIGAKQLPKQGYINIVRAAISNMHVSPVENHSALLMPGFSTGLW